jgi:hypothetical protein
LLGPFESAVKRLAFEIFDIKVTVQQEESVLEFLNNLLVPRTEWEWGCRTDPPELEFLKSLWGLGTEKE